MHLPSDILLKDQEEIWALIIQEQSQYLDPNKYIKLKWLVKIFLIYYKNCVSFRSEVNILTLADTSGFMVQSTNIRTYKIDGPIFKPFSMIYAMKSNKARLFLIRRF